MHTTTLDNPKIADALARTYARSLFDLALAAGTLDEVTDELAQIVELLHEQPKLKALFDLPSITPSRRAVSLREIFKGNISDLTYRFLGVVNAKGRLGHLALIAVAFGQMVKEHQGEVDVAVVSARELTGDQRERIRQRISKTLDRQAVLHTRVDPSIIGGLTIRVGDKQIDGSIAGQLRRMKKQLIERGREAIKKGQGPV